MYVNLCVDMCTWVQKRALDLEWVMGIKFRPLPEQCACFHWRVSPVPFHFPPCLCFHWLIFIECNGGFRLDIFTHVFRSYSYFSTPLPQSSPQTLALGAELTHANSLCRSSLVLVPLTWTSLDLRDSFGVCRAVFLREFILRQACMLGTAPTPPVWYRCTVSTPACLINSAVFCPNGCAWKRRKARNPAYSHIHHRCFPFTHEIQSFISNHIFSPTSFSFLIVLVFWSKIISNFTCLKALFKNYSCTRLCSSLFRCEVHFLSFPMGSVEPGPLLRPPKLCPKTNGLFGGGVLGE